MQAAQSGGTGSLKQNDQWRPVSSMLHAAMLVQVHNFANGKYGLFIAWGRDEVRRAHWLRGTLQHTLTEHIEKENQHAMQMTTGGWAFGVQEGTCLSSYYGFTNGHRKKTLELASLTSGLPGWSEAIPSTSSCNLSIPQALTMHQKEHLTSNNPLPKPLCISTIER